MLVKNFIKSMEVKKKFDDIPFSGAMSHLFDIEHYSVIVTIYDDKILRLVFWSHSFDNIFQDSFSITDIPNYFDGLESKFSKSDIEIIEEKIYGNLIGTKGAVTNIISNRLTIEYFY